MRMLLRAQLYTRPPTFDFNASGPKTAVAVEK